MVKLILFTLFLGLLSACGQKSVIKNAVRAERLADAYGDGRSVVRKLTVPLSDSSLSYESPLPELGPIIGGVTKFVGNIFAANTNLGKMQMSYTQKIPKLPKELTSVKLTRALFYMKPKEKRKRFKDMFERLIKGQGAVTFDFLEKLALQMSSVQIENEKELVSTIQTKDYNEEEVHRILGVFNSQYKSDFELAQEGLLLHYNKDTREEDTNGKKFGKTYILETTKSAAKIKFFLLERPELKGAFKRILILDKSIMIELDRDAVANEKFMMLLSETATEMDEMGVTSIDKCTPVSCLDLKIPDINLVPISNTGNGLKFDAIIHVGKVPESFNVKGFVEFEVKLDSPI